MGTLNNVTKISQVTPEVTWFLRNLGFSNYYIIKIFDLVGDAAIGLTEDNPYWILDEFPRFGFDRADSVARKLGVSPDSHLRLEAAVAYGLRSYASEGHTFAPLDEFCVKAAEFLDADTGLVRDVIEDMSFSGDVQLTNLGGRQVLYFYGFYRAECTVAGKLAALTDPAGGLPPVAGNPLALIKKAGADRGIELSKQQTDAVMNSLISGVSIITGGPGTGKTTIINALISILEESGQKVAVAAPTGRAAKRIMETSGHPACTVHRLLEYFYNEETGYMSFGKNSENPLDYNAIIIDEASMLDLMLTEALCNAIKPGTRLILVGDADQLPSVGAGNVLADLIDSDYFYITRLTEIHRQSAESRIVVNAHRINRGDAPAYGDDFLLVRADKQQVILDKIAEMVTKLPSGTFQVLTPTKKGILGNSNMNARLQQVLNPPSEDKAELEFGSRVFRIGDRVMQIKNDYRLEYRVSRQTPGQFDSRTDGDTGKGVFNGEIGRVAGVDTEMRTVTVVYDEERWVEYSYVQLDEIELAYAVTVHKSQGSEFPTVIIPMTWFPPVLATRSLIYTAVTRGKNQVVIVGNPAYLEKMAANNQSRSRNSGLKDRLIGMYGFY
ncbi:MAG: ATP-dependent RecD-like DNA helicase [Anaerovoracaceae bacterium]